MNYCRQILKYAQQQICLPDIDPKLKRKWEDAIVYCDATTKFLLPKNGVVLDDPDLRALDNNLELRLPYPNIALEWVHPKDDENRAAHASKRVLFALEIGVYIGCYLIVWIDAEKKWSHVGKFSIPRVGYIHRRKDGPTISIHPKFIEHGLQRDAFCLLGMLNALQCSNVHTERLPARRPTKNAKTTLPFDEYRILTIDVSPSAAGDSNGRGGTHRSPREHLRRGHIVRPEGRRPFWRNATVVNAGRSLGVVHKDYRVKSSARHKMETTK